MAIMYFMNSNSNLSKIKDLKNKRKIKVLKNLVLKLRLICGLNELY